MSTFLLEAYLLYAFLECTTMRLSEEASASLMSACLIGSSKEPNLQMSMCVWVCVWGGWVGVGSNLSIYHALITSDPSVQPAP